MNRIRRMNILEEEPPAECCEVSLAPLFPLRREAMGIEDFIKQVEYPYRGLGIPTLYSVLSILANKSVFFIADRGTGKTRIIKSTPNIPDIITEKWDSFTYGELDDLCYNWSKQSEPVRDKHFVFKIEEYSTMSDYHRSVFLTVCSKLISDGGYRHITVVTPNLHIENCKFTLLIAIQPLNYSHLCYRYTQWESMSYDRFTKFLLLNPLRNGRTINVPFVPTLPREISTSVTMPQTVDLSQLVTLFEGQVSTGRAYLYASDYAIAVTRFLGENTVQQEHVDTFYNLFKPYLASFSNLQQRKDLNSSIVVSAGHMTLMCEISKHLEGIPKQQLAYDLKVSERTIERNEKLLLERGLIRKNGTIYYISEELDTFFNWYKTTFSV